MKGGPEASRDWPQCEPEAGPGGKLPPPSCQIRVVAFLTMQEKELCQSVGAPIMLFTGNILSSPAGLSEALRSGEAKNPIVGLSQPKSWLGLSSSTKAVPPQPRLRRDCWELLEPLSRGGCLRSHGCLCPIPPGHSIVGCQSCSFLLPWDTEPTIQILSMRAPRPHHHQRRI